jgi:hypothetical protein
MVLLAVNWSFVISSFIQRETLARPKWSGRFMTRQYMRLCFDFEILDNTREAFVDLVKWARVMKRSSIGS